MKKIEINKRYICDNCGKFLFKVDFNGYIKAATNKGFSLNPVILKIKCQCGQEHKFLK